MEPIQRLCTYRLHRLELPKQFIHGRDFVPVDFEHPKFLLASLLILGGKHGPECLVWALRLVKGGVRKLANVEIAGISECRERL